MDSLHQRAELWVVSLQRRHGFDDGLLNELLAEWRHTEDSEAVEEILRKKGYEV